MKYTSQIFLVLAVVLAGLGSPAVSNSLDPSPWDIQVTPRPSFYPEKNSREVSVHYTKISKVSLYTKPFCSECDNAKNYLKDKGVVFEEVDSLLTLTGVMSITLSSERPPIAIIDYDDGTRRRVSGFDKAIYDTVLGSYRSGGATSDFDISGSNREHSRPIGDTSFDIR